jgi:hypothetical protein
MTGKDRVLPCQHGYVDEPCWQEGFFFVVPAFPSSLSLISRLSTRLEPCEGPSEASPGDVTAAPPPQFLRRISGCHSIDRPGSLRSAGRSYDLLFWGPTPRGSLRESLRMTFFHHLLDVYSELHGVERSIIPARVARLNVGKSNSRSMLSIISD